MQKAGKNWKNLERTENTKKKVSPNRKGLEKAKTS
jgi:hypothetical protein